jgi:hypothetical protein
LAPQPTAEAIGAKDNSKQIITRIFRRRIGHVLHGFLSELTIKVRFNIPSRSSFNGPYEQAPYVVEKLAQTGEVSPLQKRRKCVGQVPNLPAR